MPAMVTPKHDDCMCRQAELLQFFRYSAKLGIHVAHGGVIAMDERARLLVVERPGFRNVAVLTQLAPTGGRISGRPFRRRPQRRHTEMLTRIQVPIPLGRAERQMRFEEADRDEKWLAWPLLRRA